MRERPILLNVPMVRAILAGHKTQTRRIVKPQPTKMGVVAHDGFAIGTATLAGGKYAMWKWPAKAVGDRLWVRETWNIDMRAWGEQRMVFYRATIGNDDRVKRWRPSIHMPRWASRITLEVTGVRVERLQWVSAADAIAEGCQAWREWDLGTENKETPIEQFRALWDSINQKRAPWASNPWVWVIDFRRIS